MDRRATYHNIMELTFNDLKKRDVINVVDGQCLGRVSDIGLDFPDGVLTGIYVPGHRKRGILGIFGRSKIFISESNVVKIGGDVILVDLKCGQVCSPNVKVNQSPPQHRQQNPCPQQPYECAPPCPPPPCPPKHQNKQGEFSIFSNVNERMSTDDY